VDRTATNHAGDQIEARERDRANQPVQAVVVTSFAIARGVRLAIAETIYPATAEGRSRVAPRFRLRIASHPDAGLGPS
jgi:hypothetical protein